MAKEIKPSDNHHIEWLLEKENHGLNEHGLSEIVKILILKNNELVREIKELQSEIENINDVLK